MQMKQILAFCVMILLSFALFCQTDIERFEVLISNAQRHYLTRPDTAMLLALEAYEFAESRQSKGMMIKARSEIAHQNYRSHRPEIATAQFLGILAECNGEGLDYPNTCCFVMHRLGHLYYDAGLPDSALYYYQMAIALDDKSDLLLGPDIRLSMGDLFMDLGKYSEAEFYLRENLLLTHGSGSIFETLTIFSLAKYYFTVENIDSFAKYNRIYLDAVNIQSMSETAQHYHYAAMFDGSVGTYNIELLEKTIPILEEQGAQFYVRGVYAHLGEAYDDAGRYREAYQASSKAYALLMSQTPYRLVLKHRILQTMFHAKQSLGHYEEALNLLVRLNGVDSIMSGELSRARIDSLEIQFQTELKEKEILSQQLEINKRTSQRNTLVVVGILLLLGIMGLWQRLMTNKRLAKQNAIIKEQKILALQKENKIFAMDAMITGQEEERKRIAKDLHDGLGGILSTVKLSFEAIEKEIARLHAFSPFEKAITMLDDACDEVRRISHDMMPAALTVGGLPDAVEDLGESLRDVHGITADVQVIGLKERLDENKEIMIYRILQELVMNVIKHANASKMIIQLSSHDAHLVLVVEDNGVGFNADIKSDGLGLKSIGSRADYLNGIMKIDSVTGEGTTVSIEIPV